MRAGIADVYGAHVKTKTFAVKPVKATAAGIVARAEADADLDYCIARSQTGGAPVLTPLRWREGWPPFYEFTT